MATEIEYKFLVDSLKWNELIKPEPELIIQGFLSKSERLVVRIRIKGKHGYLTLKGKSDGIKRSEFEYEIPLEDAKDIINEFTDKYIIKKRYLINDKGFNWEVDVFEGNLKGLILAELEVPAEDVSFAKPEWVTEDVSSDPNYYNAVLIDRC